MTKSSVADWDTTADGNTDINNIDIAEGMLAKDTNNAFREMMSQLGTFAQVTLPATYQPLDAGLTSIAAQVTAADKMLYTTASDAYATTALTSFGRQVAATADAAALRTLAGITTGSGVLIDALLGANNLSDIDNADTALGNLGGGTAGIAALKGTTPEAVRKSVAIFDTAADLSADTTLAYTSGNPTVSTGDIVEAGGYRYEVAATGASDNDVITAGSVKLYIKGLTAAKSLEAYFAVGDDATDNTTILSGITRANVSSGIFDAATLSPTVIEGVFSGEGQIRTSDNNLLARNTAVVQSAPSSYGTHTSGTTAFNGDWSKSLGGGELIRIIGATTLQQPTTGFKYNEELASKYGFGIIDSTAGYNHDTASATGRTIWTWQRFRGLHSGNGGMGAYHSSISVNGAKAGATHFLANPAAANVNAEAIALAAGVYLNPFEANINDGGFDAAAHGYVANIARSVATGALSAYHGGVRIQSTGAAAINYGFLTSGKVDVVFDGTKATATSGAILAMTADNFIFGNATAGTSYASAVGNDKFGYVSATSSWDTFIGGTAILRVNASSVNLASGLALASSGVAVIDTSRHFRLRSYTVAGLPSAGNAGAMAYCSNEAGGATPIFADGTNWRRVSDRAVVS